MPGARQCVAGPLEREHVVYRDREQALSEELDEAAEPSAVRAEWLGEDGSERSPPFWPESRPDRLLRLTRKRRIASSRACYGFADKAPRQIRPALDLRVLWITGHLSSSWRWPSALTYPPRSARCGCISNQPPLEGVGCACLWLRCLFQRMAVFAGGLGGRWER